MAKFDLEVVLEFYANAWPTEEGVEAKLHGESKWFKGVLMITMMITKDDDKGDDKKLKDQSKNNSRESKINQEQFKSSR